VIITDSKELLYKYRQIPEGEKNAKVSVKLLVLQGMYKQGKTCGVAQMLLRGYLQVNMIAYGFFLGLFISMVI